MDIYELDSYRLSDAVKFHDELNPALWDGKTMRPEVREALLKIAEDFKEFMGIEDLAVEDVTVSGSNAAYSYTPHSDIDLHLVVDFSKLNPDEVYQELFNAKKYQYNDQHNIKIRGYDVELYVQDSGDPVRSLGEYSIVNDDWIRIPVARRANLDEKSTSHKYNKLKELIGFALQTRDLAQVNLVTDTIKKYRRAGLDEKGEFGPENLAYKILRTQGAIDKLFKHKAELEDQQLSLTERKKKKSKKKFKYGSFGGFFYPGYSQNQETEPAADAGGIEEQETVKLQAKSVPIEKVVRRFIHFAGKHLKLKEYPKIYLRGEEFGRKIHSFGHYVDDRKTIEVETHGRHIMDVLRTLAHELVHYKQHQTLGKKMPHSAGKTGSPYENQAHAIAGVIMRHFQNKNPEFFGAETVSEDNEDDDVDAQYGNQEPLGPESPPQMPAGTTKIDVSDLTDWYKLGMTISDLDDAKPEDFGKGPPQTVIVFPSDEFEQPYLKQLKRLGLKAHDIDVPGQEDIDEGKISQALGAAALAGSMAMSPAQAQDLTPTQQAYQIGRTIYNAPRLLAGLPEELRGLARDMARGQAPVVRIGGRNIFQEPATPMVRSAANALGATAEEAYQNALAVAYEKANKNYGPINISDWKPVEYQADRAPNNQVRAMVVLSGPAPIKESSGYIPTKKQANDPRFKTALTVDIKPGQTGKEANKLGLGTDSQGHPNNVYKSANRIDESLFNSLRDEFALLEDEMLGEIKMSPSSLKAEAAKIGAMAGMEFEMIVPNTQDYSDPEYEPDYDQDESVYDIRDVQNFFYDGDYNSRRDVANLVEEMTGQFEEWLSEQKMEKWGEEAMEYVRDWLWRTYEDEWREEAEDAVLNDAPEFGANDEELREKIEEMVRLRHDEVTEETLADMGSDYDAAYDEWSEEFESNAGSDMQREWLQSEGLETMADIERNYDIQWPHWNQVGGDDGAEISEVADDFSDAVGMKVNWSANYHGGRREPNAYVVEPDGSLDGDNPGDSGLEFVSPPMPIDKMLEQLNKVKEWAGNYGCYTNSSTGLHINISVPNYDLQKLDYVKLALLLGDEYVLDAFGRSSNTYTKSAMGKIRNIITNNPEKAEKVLELMKGHMSDLATKAIHTGTTDKYTSINTKSGYIEFRSPGGDWLDENFDKIENTLLRFTVALSAAMDPDAYRQEYQKKLYKLLSPKGNKDTLYYFAQYASGEIPKAALRSFIKQAQLERKLKKDPTGGQQYWWNVQWDANRRMEVVAGSKKVALQVAAEEWGVPEERLAGAEVTPLRPYQEPRPTTNQPASGSRNTLSQSDIENRLGWGGQEADANYEVVDRSNNRSVFKFIANTPQEAQRKYTQVLDVFGFPHDTENYGFREIALPGSTLDLQRQRAQQSDSHRSVPIPGVTDVELDIPMAEPRPLGAGRELVGWKIVDSQGNELYKFSGVGNSQADANRTALAWISQQRNAGRAFNIRELEVVPDWREA